MYAVSNFLKTLSRGGVLGRPGAVLNCVNARRSLADKGRADVNSKQVAVQGNENEERLRVRRARPADVPRVMRFVREHARTACSNPLRMYENCPPGLLPQRAHSHLMLCDYVARALAQGHSMLAEQQEAKRGWSQIRGLAVATSVCPWDAAMLEKWAGCVRCTRSRRLMYFTAHCLRAPGLHDKYRVHNILQVVLIVPPDTPKSTEIVQMLAKNVIQRGRDVGFPLLRFDVTNDSVAQSLEELKLKKEWQQTYEIVPKKTKEKDTAAGPNQNSSKENTAYATASDSNKSSEHFIAVYTALTHGEK